MDPRAGSQPVEWVKNLRPVLGCIQLCVSEYSIKTVMVAGNHSSTGVYHPSKKTRILTLPTGDLGGLVPGQKFITSQSYNPQVHRDSNSPRPENIEFPLPEGVRYVHQNNSGNVLAPSSTGNNDLKQ